MMVSSGLFGWSPQHMQPLTPVSEVSETRESPSLYMDAGGEPGAVVEVEVEEVEAIDPPPASVPFSRLFACVDGFDWILMALGSITAAAHGAALVVYLHYFGKVINLLNWHGILTNQGGILEELFDKMKTWIKSSGYQFLFI